jgi:hypothetical protein
MARTVSVEKGPFITFWLIFPCSCDRDASFPLFFFEAPTSFDLGPLLQQALAIEEQRAEDEADDSEGAELTLDAIDDDELSDLTPLDSDESPPPTPPSTPLPTAVHLPSATESSYTGEEGRSRAYRKKLRSKKRVNKKLNLWKLREEDDGLQIRSYKVVSSISKKYARPVATSMKLDISALPHSSTAYVGKRLLGGRTTPWTIEQLLEKGFKLHEWDGR